MCSFVCLCLAGVIAPGCIGQGCEALMPLKVSAKILCRCVAPGLTHQGRFDSALTFLYNHLISMWTVFVMKFVDYVYATCIL